MVLRIPVAGPRRFWYGGGRVDWILAEIGASCMIICLGRTQPKFSGESKVSIGELSVQSKSHKWVPVEG